GPPAHTAPQLVQLGEAETFGTLDDHHRGIGHVDPDLDHRGGHHDLGLALDKTCHFQVFVRGLHLTVHDGYLVFGGGEIPGHALIAVHQVLVVQGFGLLDQGVDHIDLPTLFDLFPDEGKNLEAVGIIAVHGGHGFAPRGQLIDHRNVQVPVYA